jgi:two-component system response regulator FixJ
MKHFSSGVDGDNRFQTYIVDDNQQIRMSMAFILDSFGVQHQVFETGEAFLDRLADLTPGPILLDIRMSGIDGIGVLAVLAERGVKWPVIMMTGHGDVAIAVTAMKMGAIEFLEKPFNPETLIESLTRGFAILSETSAIEQEKAAARSRLAALTPRESDVVHSLIDGSANKIVAYKLGLSPRTVEMHRANAFAKLGLRSIADLVRIVSAAGTAATRVDSGGSMTH